MTTKCQKCGVEMPGFYSLTGSTCWPCRRDYGAVKHLTILVAFVGLLGCDTPAPTAPTGPQAATTGGLETPVIGSSALAPPRVGGAQGDPGQPFASAIPHPDTTGCYGHRDLVLKLAATSGDSVHVRVCGKVGGRTIRYARVSGSRTRALAERTHAASRDRIGRYEQHRHLTGRWHCDGYRGTAYLKAFGVSIYGASGAVIEEFTCS